MVEESGPDDEQGLGDLLGRLVDDARSWSRAEIDYYHLVVRGRLREARTGLWFGALATGLALATAVALVVGLVLTLSRHLGPGWATLIVVVGFGSISAVIARLAWLQVKRVLKGLGK